MKVALVDGATSTSWRALRAHRNLAVLDQLVVPRRANWGAPAAKFQLSGF